MHDKPKPIGDRNVLVSHSVEYKVSVHTQNFTSYFSNECIDNVFDSFKNISSSVDMEHKGNNDLRIVQPSLRNSKTYY